MKVQKSIEIMAPPENIWPFMTEPEKIRGWYTPLQEFKYTGDRPGEVGTPLFFQEKVATGIMKLDCEVTENKKNESFAFKMTSGNMMKSYEERWLVEATPSGSRFTFTEQGEIPGFGGRLMGPIAQIMSGATVNKMLKTLKSQVEAQQN
jgi:uncharacterized protein YndB with AHSA1/START domain